jgi:hypothetical protein
MFDVFASVGVAVSMFGALFWNMMFSDHEAEF